MNWNLERLKDASIGDVCAPYEGIAESDRQKKFKSTHPELFSFRAISIGDHYGQAFLVPLDESSEETAELILRAIKAYQGD